MSVTDDSWNRLVQAAEANNGHLTTAQAEEAGVSRTMLTRYVESGRLIRVCRGHYVMADSMTDEYALLQARSSRIVFSHGTALFFWGLSDRVPHIIDLTVPQGTNTSRLKQGNPYLRFHYVQPELFELGATETVSPQGNNIILYDKERCICDLIRARKHMDMQIYSQAIKDYFAQDADNRKLLKYGKKFGIEDKIRTYMEVLL